MNVTDYVKTYWPIFVTILTLAVGAIVKDTNNSARITALEGRADRQTASLMGMQLQVTSLANDVSGIKSDIGSIKDNVSYIRNRIDKATQ